MKKLIAILLCLVMVVSMVACGGEGDPLGFPRCACGRLEQTAWVRRSLRGL